MIHHQILDIMNEARDKYTEMKQLVAVATHIECTRLTSFGNSCHI